MADDDEKTGKGRDEARPTGAEPTAPVTTPPAAGAPSPATADLPRPPPPPDHVARVLSAHVRTIIERRVVRLGIPEQDREDYQQSITEALLFMADPPADLDGCAMVAHTITARKVASGRRQAADRAELHAGLTDQADEHSEQDARGLANGDHALRLATLREALDDGTLTDRDARMLTLKREGHTDAAIAQQVGVAPQTVSNRITMARRKLRELWHVRKAQVATLALTVLVLVLAWRKREEIAALFQEPAPRPAPTHTVPVPEPSIPVAVLQATELRQQAAKACRDGDYKTCSDRLEAAFKLDPGGDSQPGVRDLRHQVEDHIRPAREFGAKPGYPQ